MAKVREIKRRIKSVDSTKQITRAMEMVATSKIKRAQSRIEGLRPYTAKLKHLLDVLITTDRTLYSPFMEQRQINSIAIISVTADRGLCGAFNSSILRNTEKLINKETNEKKNVKLITIGRKGLGYFRYVNQPVEYSYTGISDSPTFDNAKDIIEHAASLFLANEVDKVIIVYNRFYSAMDQKPFVENLLPVIPDEKEHDADETFEYIIEPSAEFIFKDFLFNYLQTALFKALVDSAASEHAARRKAMKAATDNAQEMIDGLTRTYNRARQAQITQEIAEIVGGAEALGLAR